MTATATSTLVHTSSRALDNNLRIARVLAAGRVRAERLAAEALREAQVVRTQAAAQAWVAEAVAAGATMIGHKICMAEGGKWRGVIDVEGAAGFLARASWYEDSVEAWGLNDAGEYVGGTW